MCRGHYALADDMPDSYALLQSRCSKAVYSYGTALYFWGLSDRVPHLLDITVPQGTNVSRLQRQDPSLRFHYVRTEIYALGRTELDSPLGSPISLYDKERCICDLVRLGGRADRQLYVQAIKGYFADEPDIRKLFRYGKQLGVAEKLRIYTEVLT